MDFGLCLVKSTIQAFLRNLAKYGFGIYFLIWWIPAQPMHDGYLQLIVVGFRFAVVSG